MTEMSNICNCKCLTEMRDKVSKLKPEVPASNIRKRISHLIKKKNNNECLYYKGQSVKLLEK